jgi:hypothetical protein
MALKGKSLDKVRPSVPVEDTKPVDEMVKFNMNIPKSIRTKWRKLSIDKDKTMTDLMIEAMEKTYFSKQ